MSLSVVARWSCVLLVVVACREIPTAPVVIDAHLSSTELWSGGELRITAASFAPPAALPVVELGADSLVVQRIDDSTVSARLPRTAGSFEVRVIQGRGVALPGTVHLNGFRDVHDGPPFSGTAYQLVAGGPPILIGYGDSGAAYLDLTFNSVVPVTPDSIHSPDCGFGVGPTYLPGTWVFSGKTAAGTCLPARVWSLVPSLHVVDTVGGLANSEGWYTMAQPGPHRWVFDWNNFLYLYDCSGGAPCPGPFTRDRNGPWATILSPRADRFVMIPTDQTTVIYDAASMDTAYVDSTFGGVAAAAFSLDEDTLYLEHSANLVALHAGDGAPLGLFSFDSLPNTGSLYALATAPDPVRPLVYAAREYYDFTVNQWRMELLTIDRTTWRLVGNALVTNDPGLIGNPVVVVPSPSERLVYVVATYGGFHTRGLRPTIWRFDTPP